MMPSSSPDLINSFAIQGCPALRVYYPFPNLDHVLQLANALNSLDVSPEDLDSLVIFKDVVLGAVRKLK